MVEVVSTNFAPIFHLFFCSQILKISSRIIAPIVAPPSDSFQICFIHCKELFFLEKNANNVKIGLGKITLRLVEVIHYVTDTVELCKRDTKTANTLSPHTDVCVVQF